MKIIKYRIKVNIAKTKFQDKVKENEQKGRRLL